jgi:hypothetical protein
VTVVRSTVTGNEDRVAAITSLFLDGAAGRPADVG